MSRVIAFGVAIACLGLLAFDGQLALSRVGAGGVHPINLWKIAVAAGIQFASLAFAAWYALFLFRNEGTWAQQLSLRIKLLPFIVPVVVLLLSATLLEIGLYCGDQPLPSVRGRPVCPNP